MIGQPSLYREYPDFWPGDPAFVQPPPAPERTAPKEEVDRYKATLKEHYRKIEMAREIGNWTALLVEGGNPTKFVKRPVDRNIWRQLKDRVELAPTNPMRIGPEALAALLFRLSIIEVVGFEVEVKRAPDPKWNGWVMAQPELVTALDSIDEGIVTDLAYEVLDRLQGGIRPKS